MMRYVMAVTDEEKSRAYRSRFEVYDEEGLLLRHRPDDGLLTDFLDDLETTQNFIALDKGEVVGTVRLLCENAEVERTKGWSLGLAMGEAYDLEPYRKAGIKIAELPRSTVHRDYRGKPVIINLWNKAIRHARLMDITHIAAMAVVEAADDDEIWRAYDIMKRRGLVDAQFNLSPQTTLQGQNNTGVRAIDPERTSRTIELSEEDIAAYEPPPAFQLYIKMGIKIVGPPVYLFDYGKYVMPLVLDLTKDLTKLTQKHLLKNKPRQFVNWHNAPSTPGVVHLTFGAADNYNRIGTKTFRELRDAFEEIRAFTEHRSNPTAVIISPRPTEDGTVRRSHGFDLQELLDGSELISRDKILDCVELGHEVINAINSLAQRAHAPIIIIGISSRELYGLALELYSGICDFIFAARSSTYALPEINFGIMPGLGGLMYLEQFLTPQRIRYLAMGHPIDAQKAVDWGLALDVSSDDALLEDAVKFAQTVTKKNSHAAWRNKRTLRPLEIDKTQSEILQVQFYEALNRKDALERILRYTGVMKKKAARKTACG